MLCLIFLVSPYTADFSRLILHAKDWLLSLLTSIPVLIEAQHDCTSVEDPCLLKMLVTDLVTQLHNTHPQLESWLTLANLVNLIDILMRIQADGFRCFMKRLKIAPLTLHHWGTFWFTNGQPVVGVANHCQTNRKGSKTQYVTVLRASI